MKKIFFLLIFASFNCFAGSDSSFVAPNNSSYSQTTVTVTASGGKILDVNPNRRYLLIQNKGASTVALKMDSNPDLNSNAGVSIIGGGNYEPAVPPTNAFFLKSTSGSQILEILEGTQ